MIVGFIYEDQRILLQLIIVSIFLVFELLNLVRVRHQKTRSQIIKVKSNDWLYGIFTSMVVGYFFTREPLNLTNQVAIGLLILATLLRVWTFYRKTYIITDEGIFDLFDERKIVNPNNITELRVSDSEISVDTEKYRNDFQIKKSELRKPNWNELKESFSEFERTWANNR
jgi:hypothetical protein